jgi:membrane-bound metal-dependent hydrolase YbcI (DUF457 family)
MPDLLTHVLTGYILATVLSFRYEWLTPQYVTVAMLGALLPDLTKIKLIVASGKVETLLGIPFDWYAVHTLGGALVAVTIGALMTDRENRKYVFALLLLGALSHLFLDALLLKASGYSEMPLWPFTARGLPTPGFYLSSDRWPALVTGTIAVVVWYTRYRR